MTSPAQPWTDTIVYEENSPNVPAHYIKTWRGDRWVWAAPAPFAREKTDPVVNKVCQFLQSRSAVGIKKYGTTLAASGLSVEQLKEHLAQELGDALNYLFAMPPRRVVAWRLVWRAPDDSEITGGWINGDFSGNGALPPGAHIERAYSE